MNRKRRMFVEEYLKCFTPAKAARRAGYAHPQVMGCRLMKVQEIHEEIDRRIKETQMDADEVLTRLAQMARANISDFVGDVGQIDFKKVKEKGYLVKKVVHQKGQRSVIELHDSKDALRLLGRHHALFTDRVKVDDWRTEIIELLKEGTILPEQVINEFGRDLATELFAAAGVPVGQSGEAQATSGTGEDVSVAAVDNAGSSEVD